MALEVICLFVLQKALFSLWNLILTLQFLTYISVWQIRYPKVLGFVLTKLRVIALGEFVDNLEIGKHLAEALSIPSGGDKAVDEKIGEERLGQSSILANLGPSLLVLSIIFVLVILVVLLLTRCKNKCHNCVILIKRKVLYNPIIRYIILNSLKLTVASFVALKAWNTATDIAISIGLIAIIAIAALTFFCLLKTNHENLKDSELVGKIGTLYQNNNVHFSTHKTHYFPLSFFVRRFAFASVTVYMLEKPQIQMVIHHTLTMLAMSHLAFDSQAQATRGIRFIEIGSELLLHATSIILS